MRKIFTFSVVFSILGIGAIIANGRPFSSTLGAPVVLISEEDGDPISRLRLLLVPNDSLTDNGGGTLSLDTSSGDADAVAVAASTTALQVLIDLNITALAQVGIDTDTLKGLIDNNATELVAVGVSTQALQDAIDAINFDSVFEAVGLSTQTNADNILTNAVDISTTGVAVDTKVSKAGDTMTGQLTLDGSTLTVTGNAFSVGTSTLVVKEGLVGIRTDSPAVALDVTGSIRSSGEIQPQQSADCDALTPSRLGALCYDTGINELMHATSTLAGGYAVPVGGTGVALGDSPTWTGSHTWDNVLLGPGGPASAPAYSFSGDTNTGMYSDSGDNLSFAVGGSNILTMFDGAANLVAILRVNSGDVSSPGFQFRLDNNTGMSNPGGDILGFSTGGLEKMRIDPSGNVGVNETSPNAKLEVKAAIQDLFTLQISSQDGSAVMVVDKVGFVGIGEASPISLLHLDGGNIVLLNDGNDPQLLIGDFASVGNHANILWDSSDDKLKIAVQGHPDQIVLTEQGAVGFGVTDPNASVEIVPEIDHQYSLQISSQNGTAIMQVDRLGHTITTGPDPVLTSCGTTPSVSGSDRAGNVTIGTEVTTSCTVTFAEPYASTPSCTVTGDNTAVTYARTITASVLTIISSADMASDVVSYNCVGL